MFIQNIQCMPQKRVLCVVCFFRETTKSNYFARIFAYYFSCFYYEFLLMHVNVPRHSFIQSFLSSNTVSWRRLTLRNGPIYWFWVEVKAQNSFWICHKWENASLHLQLYNTFSFQKLTVRIIVCLASNQLIIKVWVQVI